MVFSIEMLPAQQGDALWIEYGPEDHPRRILIDAGTPPTAAAVKARIDALPADTRVFELLIVTHIDTDHIGGVLRLLADPTLDVTFKDVWFNAYRHLPEADADLPLGVIDGEILDRLLKSGAGGKVQAWNGAFDDQAVALPDEGAPLCCRLDGGLELTVLAPGTAQLVKLRKAWVKVIDEAQMTDAEIEALVAAGAAHRGIDLPLGGRPNVEVAAAAKFESDSAPANGSSIVVLAEFEGKSALLTGDAFAPVVAAGVQRLLEHRGGPQLAVSAVKLGHHGSRNNISRELLGLLDSKRFLFSSSGAIFGHPDVEAISRVLVTNGPDVEMDFNYRVPTTDVWDDPVLRDDPRFPFTVRYPAAAGLGRKVVL